MPRPHSPHPYDGAVTSTPSPTIVGKPPAAARFQTLGRHSSGSALPSIAERLVPPMPGVGARGRLVGWLVLILIAAFAGFVRFYHLGRPHSFVFDEIYYPKDAQAMLHHGVEFDWVANADVKILAGADPVPLMTTPSFVVHPPLGKWFFAVSEWLFGMTPFGWRFVVALMGTVSVLMIGRIVRRLTRSDVLGAFAALLLAVDGLHLVMSRTGLLDLQLMFWIMAGVGALLIDRDWSRTRLAAAIDPLTGRLPIGSRGPRMLVRPWRIAAGLAFGAATATKWNSVYVLTAFALLSVVWDYGARRMVGTRRLELTWLRFDAIPAFGSTVVVTAGVYLASWTGWLVTGDGYDRQWSFQNPAGGLTGHVPDALRSLWHYHAEMIHFHTTLTADHPYKANAWSWLILGRPTAFYSDYPAKQPCDAKECVATVVALGTPLLWWAACIAIVVALVVWIGARDWRFGVPVVGVAATWLPWFPFGHRPIFYFYAIAILPFLVIALALAAGLLIGPPGAAPRRRLAGMVVVAAFTVAVVVNFAYFYPIYTAEVVSRARWAATMWFNRWI